MKNETSLVNQTEDVQSVQFGQVSQGNDEFMKSWRQRWTNQWILGFGYTELVNACGHGRALLHYVLPDHIELYERGDRISDCCSAS